MNKNHNITVLGAGFIAGVISFWFNPYNETVLAGISIWLLAAILSFLAALLMTIFLKKSNWKIATLVIIGAMVAYIGRIFFDLLLDSSSHNLFPLELLFALAVTAPSAYVGSHLRKLIYKK